MNCCLFSRSFLKRRSTTSFVTDGDGPNLSASSIGTKQDQASGNLANLPPPLPIGQDLEQRQA